MTLRTTVCGDDVFVAARDATQMYAKPRRPVRGMAPGDGCRRARKPGHQRPTDFSNVVLDRFGGDDHVPDGHVIDQCACGPGTDDEVPLTLSKQVLRLHGELGLSQTTVSQLQIEVLHHMTADARTGNGRDRAPGGDEGVEQFVQFLVRRHDGERGHPVL